MARRKVWEFSPGEKRPIGVSMDSELGASVSMAGETPQVTLWTKSGDVYTQVASGFTIANAQVNTVEQTADDSTTGETIGIGRGIFWMFTAPTTPGDYYFRSECDASDGSRPTRGEGGEDKVVVSGPGVPS